MLYPFRVLVSIPFIVVRTLSVETLVLSMDTFTPPVTVRGMTKLDRKLFTKTIEVPCFQIESESVLAVKNILRKYVLKIPHCKPVQPIEPTEINREYSGTGVRQVILDPRIVTTYKDILEGHREQMRALDIDESCLKKIPFSLTYENWNADEIIKAVVPEDKDSAAGYSLVGHIVHLNLRPHLLDYKYLIGEVFLDKIKQARTVVNKVDTIDNTYRFFKMEILCGENDMITEVKENYVRYKFDFSSVYWNPRLSTEHERIISKLNAGDVLYDVFAGVGPFAVPAAKKKCTVLANDLNPESVKWLEYNAKLNKVDKHITIFNKDGADFIKTDVRTHIMNNDVGTKNIHVVMNLPAVAVTFLHAFKELFSLDDLKSIRPNKYLLVHVYCFVKGEANSKDMARSLVEEELNCSLGDSINEIIFVRNVAPMKDMMRVSFFIPKEILTKREKRANVSDDFGELKKFKL